MNSNNKIDLNNNQDERPSESPFSTVLLTNHHLKNLSGSEVTILETASVFKKLGYDISVATFSYKQPIKTFFEQSCIKVFNLLEETLPYKEYDLAWCHHSPVLSYIVNNHVKIRKVVYRTLSTIEPLETLPYYTDDLDIVLAVSGETTDYYYSNGWMSKKNIEVFPNSVPNSFFAEPKQTYHNQINKVAIVSNHVPEELLKAAVILRKRDINVDIIGHERYGNCRLVNPDVLLPYDVVITIGKTVQYCFALKIPVYCYDRFGGPGYITNNNFEKTAYHNFSGRCDFRKVEPNVLVDEILNGYKEALKLLDYLRTVAEEKYNLEKNIKGVLKHLENVNVNKAFYNGVFSKELTIQLKHNEYYLNMLRTTDKQDRFIKRQRLSTVTDYREELYQVYTSRSWRYTLPFRKIWCVLGRVLKQIYKLFNSRFVYMFMRRIYFLLPKRIRSMEFIERLKNRLK